MCQSEINLDYYLIHCIAGSYGTVTINGKTRRVILREYFSKGVGKNSTPKIKKAAEKLP